MSFTSSRTKKKSNIPSVPANFIAFLRASLAKMAGSNYIKPELIDMEFWTKIPIKFSAVKYYDKSFVRYKTL